MLKKFLTAEKVPVHELTAISICLAVVGGFLDAYTYLFRGEVFANAQTGNMVLMGISFASRNFRGAGYYFLPIAAFFLGTLIIEIFKRKLSDKRFGSWVQLSLGIEIVLLFIVGLVPKSVPDVCVNVTVSFVCSLQVNSFRRVKGLPYASTMCTGNLRSATEQLSLFLFDKNREAGRKCVRYFVVILFFCCGAALGALLTHFIGGKSVLLCSVLLLLVLCTLLWNNRKTEKEISARKDFSVQ